MLYAALAAIVGGLATVTTRLRVERQRGRRRAARQLPDGPIIVISNHTSYADGALLALACRSSCCGVARRDMTIRQAR